MSGWSGNNKLAIGYYGDDFTGSTDALEFLCRAGLKTRLFLKPPHQINPEELVGLDAIGLAGMSRSMTREEMEAELIPAFQFLNSLQPQHLHYKVCSTFDSSPTIGNIGLAIEIGRAITAVPVVPLLVAAPILGRYCFMGNLFARMGIGTGGAVYRLDRHPSMSSHPVTPAQESDLRLHLAKQTSLKTGLLPFLELNRTDAETIWKEAVQRKDEVLLIDAFEQQQMSHIGAWLDVWAKYRLLFTVGSSGIEMALGQCWNEQGRFTKVQSWPSLKPLNQLLVVSGSCSPVTGGQLQFALDHGFDECILEPERINDDQHVQQLLSSALSSLTFGRSLVLHANGTRTKQQELDAAALGKKLGSMALALLEKKPLYRVVIAGGDTSGSVAASLQVEALELLAPFTPGAPVCKALSSNPHVQGLELIFKGGQLGSEDYFYRLLNPSNSSV